MHGQTILAWNCDSWFEVFILACTFQSLTVATEGRGLKKPFSICTNHLRVLELNPFFANRVSGHHTLRITGLRRLQSFTPIARPLSNQQEASVTWCDGFRRKFGKKKTPEFISVYDVWEPLKQALLASPDVIISSQICVSKLQRFFTLGDRCWLPMQTQRTPPY